MSRSFSPSPSRLLLLGIAVAAGALCFSVLERRDGSRAPAGGNFSVCAKQQGAAARSCYSREVGRELAVVGGSAPAVTLVAPSGSAGEVTFTSVQAQAAQDPLLCDLHVRVGVTDEQVPSWLGWSEPLAAAPAS